MLILAIALQAAAAQSAPPEPAPPEAVAPAESAPGADGLLPADVIASAQAETATTEPTATPTAGTALAAVPALRPGESETVTRIRYTVTPEGAVSDCTVLTSDAPEAVQASICRTFSEKARFKPKLEGGKPVASTDEKTVRFRVGAPMAPPVPMVAGRKDDGTVGR